MGDPHDQPEDAGHPPEITSQSRPRLTARLFFLGVAASALLAAAFFVLQIQRGLPLNFEGTVLAGALVAVLAPLLLTVLVTRVYRRARPAFGLTYLLASTLMLLLMSILIFFYQ